MLQESRLEIGTHLQGWHLSVGAGPVHEIQCFVQLIVVEHSKLGKVNQQEGECLKGNLKINLIHIKISVIISETTFSTSMRDKTRSLKQPGVAAVVANASSGSSGRCTEVEEFYQ